MARSTRPLKAVDQPNSGEQSTAERTGTDAGTQDRAPTSDRGATSRDVSPDEGPGRDAPTRG